MVKSSWTGWLRHLLAVLFVLAAAGAQAGLSVYTDGTSSPPSPSSGQRTIDFDTTTLDSEQSAGKLSYSATAGDCDRFYLLFVGWVCSLGSSTGSVSYTASSSLSGFSGNVMDLYSGVNGNTTSATITFTNPTPYVGFLWGAQFVSQNSQTVKLTLADSSVVTLKNCTNSLDSTCMGAYVSTNWLTDILNLLFGWVFGDNVTYYSTYVQYQPSNGVKIKSIQFLSTQCVACGFLSSSTAQDFKVDKLTYVDPTVAPDHLEVTTSSATVPANGNVTYTIKACGNAACTLPYINGATGSLSLTGAGQTVTYSPSASFTINAGPTNTTTVTAKLSATGSATVALTGYSPTPTNTKPVFCGLGATASSTGSCTLSVVGLHHLELTTASSSGTILTPVTYAIKACADAACATLYTGGVTGTVNFTGVTTLPSSQAFAITAGNSSTSVATTPSLIGTLTASLSGVSPTPSGTTPVYCGMGVAAASGNGCGYTIGLILHHLELTTSSDTGVTCTPIVYTVRACADASCSTAYTGGVIGTLVVSGITVNYPGTQVFTIPSGSSSVTIQAQAGSTGNATATVIGLLPLSLGSPPLYCGMGASASSLGSCVVKLVDSMLSMVVSNHVSDAQQTVTISAVRSDNSAKVCAPAFANVTKAVTLKCSYIKPTSGTRSVRIGGVALNAANNPDAACDGTGQPISLNFNSSGVATTTLQYGDVGQVGLSLSLTGTGVDLGLNLLGALNFITTPAKFLLDLPTGSLVAGSNFSAKLSVLNASDKVVPNFGKESTTATPDLVRISWAKTQPTGSGAAAGIFTGKGTSSSSPISSTDFLNGVVNISDLNWTEVGKGQLSVSLVGTNYLGVVTSILNATNLVGDVGPFLPHHLEQTYTPACSSGNFNYSGQPFKLTVKAMNALGQVTANYDGTSNTSPNFAQAVSLLPSAGATSGSFDNNVPLSAFAAGQTSQLTRTFSFGSKLTAPLTGTLGLKDALGVLTQTGSDPTFIVRSGRIKVSNAFASDHKSSLAIPVQVQYWNGKTWAVNSLDSCTKIPVASVGRSNYLNQKGEAAMWTTTPVALTDGAGNPVTVNGLPAAVEIKNGNGVLTLSAPSPTSVGSVDFAFNLGSGGTDQSCLGTHPSSTGAGLSWLQALNGGANSCTGVTTYDRDPGARATFGVYKPESKKAVFSRDIY